MNDPLKHSARYVASRYKTGALLHYGSGIFKRLHSSNILCRHTTTLADTNNATYSAYGLVSVTHFRRTLR